MIWISKAFVSSENVIQTDHKNILEKIFFKTKTMADTVFCMGSDFGKGLSKIYIFQYFRVAGTKTLLLFRRKRKKKISEKEIR